MTFGKRTMTFPSAACRRVAGVAACLLITGAAFAAEAPTAGDDVAVANPYGLDALWAQGDLVARGTLAVLAIMSMASWYILLTKLFEQHRLFRQAKAANTRFWPADSVAEGVSALAEDSPFRIIAATGLKAAQHHQGMVEERVDLHTWVGMSMQRAVGEEVGGLQSGLAVLATVGSTSPFIGLFGTVWGIYHALTAIGIAGQASIDKVAGPVGEALIMTALGLAVAVPAVLGYNLLVRRNKLAIDTIRAFGSDVHSVLLCGSSAKQLAHAVPRKALGEAA